MKVTALLEQLAAPPASMIVLIILGLLLLGWRRRTGITLISVGAILLYAASMPLVANSLMRLIETPSSITFEEIASPRGEAVVILGGGRREEAPEFNLPGQRGDTANSIVIERIRYGVWLARKMKLPILVTGGLPDEDGPAEAELMKQVVEEFGGKVHWLEAESLNTYENAELSKKQLDKDGVSKIYLVTHANHMPRSLWAFKKVGLETYAAPTGYYGTREYEKKLHHYLPSANALHIVATVFHEVVGGIWYRLRY